MSNENKNDAGNDEKIIIPFVPSEDLVKLQQGGKVPKPKSTQQDKGDKK